MPNDGLQLRRAIIVQAEGKRLLEKDAIAPSAARLCWIAFDVSSPLRYQCFGLSEAPPDLRPDHLLSLNSKKMPTITTTGIPSQYQRRASQSEAARSPGCKNANDISNCSLDSTAIQRPSAAARDQHPGGGEKDHLRSMLSRRQLQGFVGARSWEDTCAI